MDAKVHARASKDVPGISKQQLYILINHKWLIVPHIAEEAQGRFHMFLTVERLLVSFFGFLFHYLGAVFQEYGRQVAGSRGGEYFPFKPLPYQPGYESAMIYMSM